MTNVYFNPELFLQPVNIEEIMKGLSEHIPDVLPVSMLDVDRGPPMDMSYQMSDPCNTCGAFRMRVGDYVCYGQCEICELKDYKKQVGAMYACDNER